MPLYTNTDEQEIVSNWLGDRVIPPGVWKTRIANSGECETVANNNNNNKNNELYLHGHKRCIVHCKSILTITAKSKSNSRE